VIRHLEEIGSGEKVLRITWLHSDGAGILKVEGRLAGEWVEELSRATSRAVGELPRVVIDLSEVTFVDPKGIELLRALRRQGVELAECSSFVSSLINGGAV